MKINQIIYGKEYLQYINEISSKLINEIGFYEGKLEDYARLADKSGFTNVLTENEQKLEKKVKNKNERK